MPEKAAVGFEPTVTDLQSAPLVHLGTPPKRPEGWLLVRSTRLGLTQAVAGTATPPTGWAPYRHPTRRSSRFSD